MTRLAVVVRAPVALVAAGLLAAAALAPVARPGSTEGTTPCEPQSTVAWLAARGDPGAGSVWYTVAVTNLSTRPCSLRGYPGVSAVDLSGRQLGSAAGRNPRNQVRTVLVAPGASARFLLQVNDPGFFPRDVCGQTTTAAGLRVYLPAAAAPSLVPVAFRACSRSGAVFLHATAVTV